MLKSTSIRHPLTRFRESSPKGEPFLSKLRFIAKPPLCKGRWHALRDGGSPLQSSYDALFTQASEQLRLHRRGVTVCARLCVKLARCNILQENKHTHNTEIIILTFSGAQSDAPTEKTSKSCTLPHRFRIVFAHNIWYRQNPQKPQKPLRHRGFPCFLRSGPKSPKHYILWL